MPGGWEPGHARMNAIAGAISPPAGGPLRSLSTFLYRRSTLYLLLLLVPPLLWLGTVYLGTLFALLTQSFYSIDEFTAQIVRKPTLATYKQLLTQPANLDIVLRTVSMAVCVTIAAAIIAFPIANYMVRYASLAGEGRVLRRRAGPDVGELPREGLRVAPHPREGRHPQLVLQRRRRAAPRSTHSSRSPGIGGPSLASSYLGMFIVFVYMWLPYMILPIAAALERVPASLLQASADLGARPRHHVSHSDLAARNAGARSRIGVHLLADAGRLHHPEHRRRTGLLHRHDGVSAAGHGRQHSAGRGVLGGADRTDRPLSRVRASGSERSMRSKPEVACGASAGSLPSRLAAYAGLAFLHFPVLIILLYAFTTEDRTYQFPPPGLTLHWFEVAFARSDMWAAMRLSLAVASRRHVDRARARHARRLRARARPFPRQADAHVLFALPIALARNHHRHRAAVGHQARRSRPGLLDHRRGPRHVLHRHRPQQRHRAAAPHSAELDRSVDGSRCRRRADLPPRAAAAGGHGAAGRRHARLRAVFR